MFSLLSSRSPTANVEAYQLAQPVHQVIPSNNPDGVGDTILDFGQTIFGLQTIDIKEWPGLLTYHQHALAEFYRYGKPWVQLAFSQACGKEAIDFKDVVTLISEVSGIIKSSPDSDCTVLDMLQRWLHHHGKDYEQLDATSWADCQSAIFCILTWTTLMIDGDVSPIHSGFQISFPPGYLRAPARQPQDAAARPIASFLRAFGQGPQFPFIDHDAAYSQPSLDLIQITCVNFAMLREFGKVSIEWTTTMTCHLLFSTLTRTLLLFRLPTFCALGCIESSSCMIECVMQSEQDDQQNPDPLSHSWLQLQREVLLSYRLIFGQDKKSCKLFARILKEDRKGKNLLQDPLLETLCTKAHNSPSMRRLSPSIWPKSCISLENELRKQEEYDVQGDFPILGQRLLAVQNFNLRQRPRTFWAFWKDTRDRPGWFTAWLALIIGGITFLLGLLQLLLAIASLAHDITSAGGIAQGNSTRS